MAGAPASSGLRPGKSSRLLVAMSGGVDSAMAAALLVDAGHDVEGCTLCLWREAGADGAAAQAREVCAQLGIPHRVLDLQDAFHEQVVVPFVREYMDGRTPNPCLRCNRLIKFGALLDYALAQGFVALATGHYARVTWQADSYHLLVAGDRRKDQTYFLYALGQRALGHARFPLGDLTKDTVRALARARGLHAAERPESQDVCFIDGSDYRRFLAERVPEAIRPGPIVNRQGVELGRHRGLPYYTVGQREGLGIGAPRPLYVLALDVPRNALVVGHRDALGALGLEGREARYVAGRPPEPGRRLEARIRYRGSRHVAHYQPLTADAFALTFDEPLRDISPGQGVVLYDGDEVLGGGIIATGPAPNHVR